MPSADQENSAAYNGFQTGKHVGNDKLDYALKKQSRGKNGLHNLS